MFKQLLNKKLLKNEKGLTLIELLAVVVILGIIAAIAIPAIGGIIENSKYKAAKADAINVISASNIYFTDNPDDATVTAKELKDNGYLDSIGKMSDGGKVTKVSGGNTILDTVTFSGQKSVKFNGANIKGISEDKQKGSAASITDIPAK